MRFDRLALRTLVLSLLSLLVAFGFFPVSASADVLQDIVKTALESSPLAQISAAQLKAAEADVARARAGFLPSLNVDASTGTKHTESPALSQEMNLTEHSFGVTIAQTIFDGFSTAANVAQQQARYASANARYREMKERIASNATDAYLNYLKARHNLDIAQENVKTHQKFKDRMENLAKTDPGRRFELTQVQARLALALSIRILREANVREAEENYTQVVGVRPPSVLTDPTLPTLPESLEATLQHLGTTSPALAIAEADIHAASEETRIARSALSPQIALEASSRQGQNLGGVAGNSNDMGIMLTARWNLFHGGAHDASERAALEGVTAAQQAKENTRRTLEERIARTWHVMHGHREASQQFSEQVKYNIQTLQAYHDQFRLNRRSLLDVLNAESELFSARSSLISGRYDHMLAAYQFLALSGHLLKTLVLDAPNSPDAPEIAPETPEIAPAPETAAMDVKASEENVLIPPVKEEGALPPRTPHLPLSSHHLPQPEGIL